MFVLPPSVLSCARSSHLWTFPLLYPSADKKPSRLRVLPTQRQYASSAVTTGGRLLVFGGNTVGWTSGTALNDVWAFNLTSNAWTQVTTVRDSMIGGHGRCGGMGRESLALNNECTLNMKS